MTNMFKILNKKHLKQNMGQRPQYVFLPVLSASYFGSLVISSTPLGDVLSKSDKFYFRIDINIQHISQRAYLTMVWRNTES